MNTNALRVAAWTVCFALSIAICFGGHDGFGFLVTTAEPGSNYTNAFNSVLDLNFYGHKLDIGFWYREHFEHDSVSNSPKIHTHCNNNEFYNSYTSNSICESCDLYEQSFADFNDQFCNPGKALTVVGSCATGILWILNILIWSSNTKSTFVQVLYFVCGSLSFGAYVALVIIITEAKKGFLQSGMIKDTPEGDYYTLGFSITGFSILKPGTYLYETISNDNIFGGAFVMLCVLLGLVTMTLAAEFIVKRFELVKNDKATEKLLSI